MSVAELCRRLGSAPGTADGLDAEATPLSVGDLLRREGRPALPPAEPEARQDSAPAIDGGSRATIPVARRRGEACKTALGAGGLVVAGSVLGAALLAAAGVGGPLPSGGLGEDGAEQFQGEGTVRGPGAAYGSVSGRDIVRSSGLLRAIAYWSPFERPTAPAIAAPRPAVAPAGPSAVALPAGAASGPAAVLPVPTDAGSSASVVVPADGGGLAPVVAGTAPLATPVVAGATETLAPVVAPVANELEPVVTSIATAVAPAAAAVAPAASGVGTVVAPVTDLSAPVVAPVVTPLVQTAAPLVVPVVEAAEPLLDAAAPAAGPVLAIAAPAVQPVVSAVHPAVAPVLEVLAPSLEAADPLLPSELTELPPRVVAAGDPATLPDTATAVLPGATGTVTALPEATGQALEGATGTVGAALPGPSPLVSPVTDPGTAIDTLPSAVTGTAPDALGVITAVPDLPAIGALAPPAPRTAEPPTLAFPIVADEAPTLALPAVAPAEDRSSAAQADEPRTEPIRIVPEQVPALDPPKMPLRIVEPAQDDAGTDDRAAVAAADDDTDDADDHDTGSVAEAVSGVAGGLLGR